MKILVVSRTPWRNDNSFGNTYSNIFDGMEDVSIANIYLADGEPDGKNGIVKRYYQISESELLKSVRKPRNKTKVGKEVFPNPNAGSSVTASEISLAKRHRWSGFFIARELVWKFGKANLIDMMTFVREFNPDIIFMPLYYAQYVSNMAIRIVKQLHIPVVLEASIDVYSMKQFSLDPVFWINRLAVRGTIKKIVKYAQKLYVISEKMRIDYSKMLGIDCGVLYKFPDLSRRDSSSQTRKKSDQIEFVYTGNVGNGRWRTLSQLGNAIQQEHLGKLSIYTPTCIDSTMKKALKNCALCKPVSSDEVKEIQANADVLVHAESFDVKQKLQARYSISTKIMDYISANRCILAIGPKDIASMEYLHQHDLAMVCYSEQDIEQSIHAIKTDSSIIDKYADKSNEYTQAMPTRKEQQEKLKAELLQIIFDFRHMH